MKIGIVGLPNVGKSTLFNAFLKRQQALSANYPFATIEPNVGVVDVPDERVDELALISKSEKKVYANITFIDIAGIVEGAHKGEGLGNQFLANIREVDLILVLLRGFKEENIVREGSKDPDSDYQIIITELILKDIETINSQEKKIIKNPKEKEDIDFNNAVMKLKTVLEEGRLGSEANLTEDEGEIAKQFHLLTLKPMLKVINASEDEITTLINENETKSDSDKIMYISAKIESELASLGEPDTKAYLSELGLVESPLNEVIKKCYKVLDLETFLTSGPKESRAWKFKKGMNAKECAGLIHTDFEKNFIKAEVIKYQDYLKYQGKAGARDSGKLRLEGKEYLMQDGDIVEFKVGV